MAVQHTTARTADPSRIKRVRAWISAPWVRIWHIVRGVGARSRAWIGAPWGSLVLPAGAAAIVLAAPLVADAVGWLWSRPDAGRVLILAACACMAAGQATRRFRRARPLQPRLGTLIGLAWVAVATLVAVLAGGAWWLMGAPALDFPASLTPAALDAIATRAFAVVAGLGGAALLVISYRRQRSTEAEDARANLALAREDTRLFTERFTTASEQLGSEHPAVRLAGVHALAHLADDAPANREDLVQMVIDVLCAYLRMPYRTVDTERLEGADAQQAEEHHRQRLEFESMREVRHTVIRVIGDRLRADTRWRGKDYDFTGVAFDGGDLGYTHFTSGRTSFRNARFTGGEMRFSGAEFTGAAVDFSGVDFAGGVVSFRGSRFTGGDVDFVKSEFTGAAVDFRGAKFVDGGVEFIRAQFIAGKVDFSLADFAGGRISFSRARFADGTASFLGAQFAGGQVDFSLVRFSGRTEFSRARFVGGEVDFSGAEFFGEQVDFTHASFSGGAVSFVLPGGGGEREARGVCPRGLPERNNSQTPDVVTFPRAWNHPD